MTPKNLATFSPDLARRIASFYKERGLRRRDAIGEIGGRHLAERLVFARITDAIQDGDVIKHGFIEVRWNQTDKIWEEEPEGYSGTSDDHYVIATPDHGTQALTMDGIYLVHESIDPETGNEIWVTTFYQLPIPQYTGMLWGGVADNTAGYDFVRAMTLPGGGT